MSCWNGNLACVRIEAGADVNKATNGGDTPLQVAERRAAHSVKPQIVALPHGAATEQGQRSGVASQGRACFERGTRKRWIPLSSAGGRFEDRLTMSASRVRSRSVHATLRWLRGLWAQLRRDKGLQRYVFTRWRAVGVLGRRATCMRLNPTGTPPSHALGLNGFSDALTMRRRGIPCNLNSVRRLFARKLSGKRGEHGMLQWH